MGKSVSRQQGQGSKNESEKDRGKRGPGKAKQSGQVKSLKDAALLVGYSTVQVTCWWECYRAKGLDALVEQHRAPGKSSQMTDEAWAGLMKIVIEIGVT